MITYVYREPETRNPEPGSNDRRPEPDDDKTFTFQKLIHTLKAYILHFINFDIFSWLRSEPGKEYKGKTYCIAFSGVACLAWITGA